MPEPAILYSVYSVSSRYIVVNRNDSVRISVNSDGNGTVDVVHGGILTTVVGVPGSALSVLSTLRSHGLNFQMRVSGSSSQADFLTLIA